MAKKPVKKRHPKKKCKTKRRQGGPSPKKPPPMTPGKKLITGELWLQGVPITHIAVEMDVDESTIRYHLDKTIKPQFAEDFDQSKATESAKVALLERVAWSKFKQSENPQTKDKQRFATSEAMEEAGIEPTLVERVMEETSRTGEPQWLDLVKWAIEWRSKVGGHYAPEKHEHDLKGNLRVAGISPGELDQEAADRLNKLRKERDEREK